MNRFMEIAIKEAYNGIKKNDGGPFGAVVVLNGEVVGIGHNQVVGKRDSTLHGEMVAIRDACKKLGTFDLSGAEIYTTSEPCPMCIGAILWANITKIYSGCNIKDAESIGFRDKKFYDLLERKNELQIECDRADCLKLFEDYKNIKNKTNY